MADEKEVVVPVGDTPQTPPEGAKPEVKDDEQLKKEQKENLDKAILEAQDTLRGLRKDIKVEKEAPKPTPEPERIPEIDRNDPNAKAWVREISDHTAPLSSEIEKGKEEVRNFALREFLADRPSLAKSPEKLKELMTNYDRIKTASERTKEGVLLDLEKSYAVTFHEELISAARNARVNNAQADALFAAPAISRGISDQAPQDTSVPRKYTEEEKAQLAKWGMTPEQHAEMSKKFGS